MDTATMFASGASYGSSMPAQPPASHDLADVKAALSGFADLAIDKNIERTTVIYVVGSTLPKRVRKQGVKDIGSSLNSIFRMEKIFHNDNEALDSLEGILSKAIDYHITATDIAITEDRYKELTAAIKFELEHISDKQDFFALISRFVSKVSDCSGVPVPAPILAAKRNVASGSVAGHWQTNTLPMKTGLNWNDSHERNATTTAESDDMDYDFDGAPDVQTNFAPGSGNSPFLGAVFDFQPGNASEESTSLGDMKLAPRQGNHGYLDGISYELRQKGLEFFHDEVERMHCKLSPFQGMLLDQDGLYELTHGLDAKVLHDIDTEVSSRSTPPSDTWLDEKYKDGVQMELIALGDTSHFLARVKEVLYSRDVEMADVTAHDSWADPTLNQEEFDALNPLKAPLLLQGLSVDKRRHFLCRMLRKAKRMNDKAKSAQKERLQPSEMMDMVHQDELAVLHRIDSAMQGSIFKRDDAAIERAYDSQSESELRDCGRLNSFVDKVKGYHRRLRNFVSAAKGHVADALGLRGDSGAAHTADTQYPLPRPPPPPVQDIKGSFISALTNAINAMNSSLSATHNLDELLFQPAEVADLVSRLEARMRSDLEQKYVDTPLTYQEQETRYVEAANHFLQLIQTTHCFRETVMEYRQLTS
ncbi:uncharacterized protein J4E78_009741 [Alternaria triticimaculans]|uniref:uncharacterized protein n=1 Tax=Alternaria triticimaculans TaxID=297637 RepID=UPI0020C4E3D2|nr:uncharacterized protein J4E78_009741 [Alternaria triticimaculans]KAI4643960.1 hypothetical protein J4E78_009741 [Alternaria triticimaculans]